VAGVEAPSSPANTYARLRLAFIDLVSRLDQEDLDLVVPATPAWTVRNVLAHVVGITADLNASDFGPGDADAWTNRQVDRRHDRTVEQLTDEWNAEAPTFEEGLTLFGDDIGVHYVADLAQHFIDVQGALGPRWSIPPDALRLGLDFYVRDAAERLLAHNLGVELHVEERTITIGVAPPMTRVTLSAFEAFRGLGGRRSLDQLRALPWEGGLVGPVDLLSAYPVPARDLDP
jgi:uncharacterized protein (TIGR03083 family)